MRKIFLILSTTVSILLLAVILVIGLPLKKSLATYQHDLQELQSQYEIQLQRSYQLAVEDAADALEDEIHDVLLSIDPENPDLKWRKVDGKPQVLMVTWSSWNGYDDKVGEKMELSREVWATAAPELQKFASELKLSENNLNIRLEQYLGLPPHGGKTKFVQMWVYPEDLYRPCPDSEINDTQCELDFPNPVEAQHEKWINEKTLNSYGEKGYPWTRLGYTFDWGRIGTEIGASEFIIRPGATVDIDSVMNTLDYVRG